MREHRPRLADGGMFRVPPRAGRLAERASTPRPACAPAISLIPWWGAPLSCLLLWRAHRCRACPCRPRPADGGVFRVTPMWRTGCSGACALPGRPVLWQFLSFLCGGRLSAVLCSRGRRVLMHVPAVRDSRRVAHFVSLPHAGAARPACGPGPAGRGTIWFCHSWAGEVALRSSEVAEVALYCTSLPSANGGRWRLSCPPRLPGRCAEHEPPSLPDGSSTIYLIPGWETALLCVLQSRAWHYATRPHSPRLVAGCVRGAAAHPVRKSMLRAPPGSDNTGHDMDRVVWQGRPCSFTGCLCCGGDPLPCSRCHVLTFHPLCIQASGLWPPDLPEACLCRRCLLDAIYGRVITVPQLVLQRALLLHVRLHTKQHPERPPWWWNGPRPVHGHRVQLVA